MLKQKKSFGFAKWELLTTSMGGVPAAVGVEARLQRAMEQVKWSMQQTSPALSRCYDKGDRVVLEREKL